jgi:nucleotidyltransferase substrate binding protein (TIGR01987 family)
MTKDEAMFEQFKESVNRLREVLFAEKNEITRDSAIKRFELSFDLSWKTVKDYVRAKGVDCFSPKNCFQAGFQDGLIEIADEKKWNDMLEKGNLTVHTYNEKLADEIYALLPGYAALFEKLIAKLEKGNKKA